MYNAIIVRTIDSVREYKTVKLVKTCKGRCGKFDIKGKFSQFGFFYDLVIIEMEKKYIKFSKKCM